MMGSIYTNAPRTVVWLGESSDDSDLAMDLVEHASPEIFTAADFDPGAKIWDALRGLMRRPWWTRMWVIQEALLSPNSVVRCGYTETSFERFNKLYDIYDKMIH